MQEIKYSFVLPAYKAHFFKEAIDSILAQTYTDFELIIVNDASPEDLYSIVKNYDDSRIRYYVNEQNIGGKDLVAQWNHCLEYATGEYIILASDDDVYFPQYLEKMDALVQKYPDVNVFRPRVQYIDKDNNIKSICGCIAEKVSSFEYWCHWGVVGSSIGHVIFKREELCKKGGFISFPMGWGADDASIIMMGDNGICFESDILYSFRMSGENISSKSDDYRTLMKKIEARKLFYNWLKDYIDNTPAKTYIESLWRDEAKQYIDNIFQGITVCLMSESTTFSMLKSIPLLLKLEYISNMVVLKRALLKIIK